MRLKGLGFRVEDSEGLGLEFLVAEWIHFNYTFWENITHYKTESVYFFGAYELSN